MSELVLRLIEENKKTRSTFLDLGNCGLTEVPEEIGELVWLEGLSFSKTWFEWDGDCWYKRQSENNKILNLPNQFASLIPTKWNNNNLKSPDISSCQRSPFSGLINLKSLWLKKTLDLKKGHINLDSLAVLTNLSTLDISYIPVSDLTPLSGLTKLKYLFAWQTNVTDLSPIKNLVNLRTLDLSGTHISDLSPLSKLLNLEALSIAFTEVSDLAPLHDMLQLKQLFISGTRISDLSPVLPLIQNGLPVQWNKLVWKSHNICLKNCQLTIPPVEIVKQGNEAILRWFAEKERAGTTKVREAKLLLVGQGKAGKTTLRKKLEDSNAEMPAPGDTTRGIEITRLDENMPQTGEPLRINVWDFGGQDIQHYAHQFFLTGNSLYALVTNERIQDWVHLPYWLNIIEMFGKKSPVLLIQNKDGGYCQALRDEAAIRSRFGNVHNRVFQTDFSQAESEIEFADLRREIVHQASLLPHVERDYLASFVELRGKLEMEADRKTHYLSWKAYLKLMPELSEDLLRDYANALTFLGVCQYFPDDAMLSQFVFLRPKWIIDALFALLLHPSLETKRGYFSEMDTFQIWQGPEYNGMQALLVRMMKQFELCYRVEGDDDTYILPQRLPTESKTYGWNETGDTPVQYRYKFMPKGILTRLICRLYERIETDPALGQRVWCDAVIFTLPDGKGRVFAREVYSENTIELRASGDKWAEMLNEVIRKMDDINRDAKYDNLQVDKLVPCPCVECERAESPFFHKYETLQKLVEKGRATSLCEKSVEDVPIDEIFGKSGVKKPKSLFYHDSQEDDMRTDRLRIFISYSHAQRDYFPIFKADFIQYARIPGLDIEVFGDDAIPIGTAWDKFLQTKVTDCDAMILLVSQEFMNSNYIQAKEFGAALERLKAERSLLIVPIYFAPCQFESDKELSRLQFFKPHGDLFGEARLVNEFSYTDLVKFRQNDGMPIPNANRQRYMLELMKKLGPELRKLG